MGPNIQSTQLHCIIQIFSVYGYVHVLHMQISRFKSSVQCYSTKGDHSEPNAPSALPCPPGLVLYIKILCAHGLLNHIHVDIDEVTTACRSHDIIKYVEV